ncbi:MAG: hypothetical protein ACYC6B_07040 [Thermoleophilia bacterium]
MANTAMMSLLMLPCSGCGGTEQAVTGQDDPGGTAPAGEDLNLIPLDDLMNSLGLDPRVWVTEIMLA